MLSEGLDALVVYGRGETNGRGRVFYVSDVWQLTGETFVVLPLGGVPFFVTTPLVGLNEAQMSSWIADLRLSQEPGREIGEGLRSQGLEGGAVGVVGLSDRVPLGYVQQLKSELERIELRDATAAFERLRRVKSSDEIAKVRDTSRVMKRLFDGLAAEIRPGVQEKHVLGHAVRLAREHGCRDVLAYMATSPFRSYTYGSDRPLEKDSSVVVWLECAGPSGYWLEFNRCYSFGPPSERARRAWCIQVESFAAALDLITPGAPASGVMSAVDRVYRSHGFAAPGPESTYLVHGIGTDTVEGLWLPGNDQPFEAGEVLSLHPFMQFDVAADSEAMAYIGITDNVLVTSAGGERLTCTDSEWIVL